MTDITQDTVMIAIQGPKAVDLVNDISDQDVSELKFFNSRNIEINKDIMDVFEEDWILSETPIIQRSGYTGEDGFEVVLPPRSGNELWKSLLKNDISPLPCGLGARDTLRLEFGFLLSGQDFDESRTTIETGWEDKCVDWKHDFVGKDRLEEMKESDHQTLRGILMVDKGIPRNGHKVYADDEMIGMVTSGTRSISLRCGIGLAYLDPGYLEEGTEITLDIRGKMRKAVVKTPPFV